MKRNLRFLLLLWYGISYTALIAQVNLQNKEFFGKISANGKGLAGVGVTDGYNIVQTNRKGEYKLLSNATAEYIYITIPSGYKIPFENQVPCFYKKVANKSADKQRVDFVLEKLDIDDDKHVTIVWADPQVAFDDEIPVMQNAANDLSEMVNRYYADLPVHGIVCGDMIAEISREPKFYPQVKSIMYNTGVPFFYVAGNHDMDVNCRSDYLSKETYKSHFGPSYYSFNRGKIHYIVLDDVFFVARGYSSIGYLDEKQFNWLEQDLALIPEGSTVIVSLHIPTFSREARRQEWGKEAMNKVLQNRQALYKMLEPYNAHIFSGHEHYNENYLIKDNIFEHVHTSLCGLFWQAPWSSDGSPIGYGVYEIDGETITWYFKTVDKDRNFQFNAYPVGMSRDKPDAITANVWNYDPMWKVYWYEDGIKMGEMKQYTGYDPTIYNYVVKNEKNFKYKYIGAGTTDHLFYAEPKGLKAKIKVEVVDRFGNIYVQEVE